MPPIFIAPSIAHELRIALDMTERLRKCGPFAYVNREGHAVEARVVEWSPSCDVFVPTEGVEVSRKWKDEP